MSGDMKAPIAKRVDTRREHHGDVFVDPYEWLRDKESHDVVDYLEAENAFTEHVTEGLAPLRQKIFDEIKARTKETDLSVPTRRGDWWYYGRSFQGKQYGVQCRCPVSDPDDWSPPQLDENTEIPGEQVLLDENVEAEGHDFFSLGAASVSVDGNILAYSVDVKGDERYTLRFKDLRTGQRYDDEIVGIGDPAHLDVRCGGAHLLDEGLDPGPLPDEGGAAQRDEDAREIASAPVLHEVRGGAAGRDVVRPGIGDAPRSVHVGDEGDRGDPAVGEVVDRGRDGRLVGNLEEHAVAGPPPSPDALERGDDVVDRARLPQVVAGAHGGRPQPAQLGLQRRRDLSAEAVGSLHDDVEDERACP